MELSTLLAPAIVLLLCVLEVNRNQGTCTLGKKSGYLSQIRIVSVNNQDPAPKENLLNKLDYITEASFDLETLRNRLNYQYTYIKNK
jgi:hypothetical protein